MHTPIPYNPLQPASRALFVGREDVFAFLRQHLVGAPVRHGLIVIGRRGLGKSSILYQLAGRIDEQYRPCVIDLGAVDLSSETALIAALIDVIHATLEASGASTYRLPDWPHPSGEDKRTALRTWFRDEFLGVALTALRTRRLLLAFDDAHLLLDAIDRGALPDDTLDYLGSLLATYERLVMLFTLDATYEDRVLSIDLLSDPALHFRLSELARDDAERLIREPMAGVLDYEEGVVEQILALAGGHPFLLHSVCRLLARRAEERHDGGPITFHDLQAIHEAAIEQAGDILAPQWASLTPNERYTLAALVKLDEKAPGNWFSFENILNKLTASGLAMNHTQLAAALRSLGYNGLVRAQGDQYMLPARLIADWVQENARLPRGGIVVRRPSFRKLAPVASILLALVIVIGLGAAAWGGFFGNGDDRTPAELPPTVTLALDLEGTRQADYATQTEQALPSATPTATATPTVTPSPTITLTPSHTPTATATLPPTATLTPRPMRTPRSTRTPIVIPPTTTPSLPATHTPRPSVMPTLDPGF